MKLVILYGAPAVGKLTIAKKLAEIADIKVFDNHQVIDIFRPLVSREYDDFTPTIRRVTLTIIEAAVKANQGDIVTTIAYAASYPGDTEYVIQMAAMARSNGAEVFPVFLKCDSKVLLDRVEEPSRKAFSKITEKDVMAHIIKSHELNVPADIDGNITIDTTKKSAASIADKVKNLAGL